MRKLPVATFVALLMARCGDEPGGGGTLVQPLTSDETIDLDDNETRNKTIAKAIDFTKLQLRGKAGEKLAYAPDQQTPYTEWGKIMRDNRQILALFQYKDGKWDGLSTWWYSNGRKSVESTSKDGKLITAVVWKLNGEKCPVTNIVNGNGVVVWYRDDGKESYRETFKDGK